ncbi:hypothetical protein [Lacticaseibacillus brantae]|uniref:SnoaL-like domain-containing protein n=1 Tax=Lacticaseibacillus brantae DSM 23927 TaxID=1423727 RepID=A0A0R2B2F3_9LACO|nr:hypothetical protein [Lacticaseibacillus brantae]KRM72148.1 hypothetical protein FC34_GL001132 [Lacticaseibacillus brantae DSM 23927]
MATVPEVLQAVIQTTNTGDSVGFVNLFENEGLIDDWGTKYVGRDRIGRWNQTDNIGRQSQFTLVDAVEEAPGQWLLHIKVAGLGFNGTSPFRFTLSPAGKIAAMQIVPD